MKIKKLITTIAILTFIPFLLASCGELKKDESQSDTVTSAAKPYSLDVCLVSGEEFGSMGDPYVFAYQGQEIKMCCKKCLKKFNAAPDKYVSLLKKGKTSTDSHDHSGHSH